MPLLGPSLFPLALEHLSSLNAKTAMFGGRESLQCNRFAVPYSILRCGCRAYCSAASSLRAIDQVLDQPLDRGSFDWNPDYRWSRHLHLIFLEPAGFDWLRFEVDPGCQILVVRPLATPADPTKRRNSEISLPLDR